jgi:hypothetical protein
MATAPGTRCAPISRALAEPMAGTAPSTRRWLLLEHPGPWGRDINQHPDPALQALLIRAAAVDLRPLLIRRRNRTPDRGPSRVYLIDTIPGGTAASTCTVGQLDDLTLPDPDDPLPGEPVAGPLLVVCTHAERDPCCGIDGKALAETLADADVFECSHLGGHRFAPTALLLPTGYLYGHLDATSIAAIHTRAQRGEVATDHCRGRCTWSPRGQVAELAVRDATGLCSPDDLVVDDDTDDRVHVVAPTGERWAVELELLDVDTTRPASCGARPTLMAPLRAAAVHALGPVPDRS